MAQPFRQFCDEHDAEGAALTASIIVAEHVVLWPHMAHVPFIVRYIIGTAALGLGYTLAAVRRRKSGRISAALGRFWFYAVVGGAATAACHTARWATYQAEKRSRIGGLVDNALRD